MVLSGPSNRMIKQVEVTGDEVLDGRLFSQQKSFNRIIGGIDKAFCTLTAQGNRLIEPGISMICRITISAESIRSNALSVVTECEQFLFVFSDDLVYLLNCDLLARCVRVFDKFFDVQEPFVIELQTDGMRFMAKNVR